MTTVDKVLDPESEARVYDAAYQLYSRDLDWSAFFRQVLGLDGLVRQAFPDHDSLASFEKTDTFAAILQMLTNLRQRRRPAPTHEERIRVITVRLPESIHNALRAEAHLYRTSMNQLCISKLLQCIDEDLVPNDS
jgi:predicted HicB family RNase H-like nuclease